MKKTFLRTLPHVVIGFLVSFTIPNTVSAMEVGVWVPWFADESGAQSATANISKIDVLYPFVYEVRADGSIVNKVDFNSPHWRTLFREARQEQVKIIPTIAWFNGEEIHTVLSNRRSRRAHIDVIVAMVRQGKFDGVNIDYEEKKSETKDHFSLFLKELKASLGTKTLTCTVEARTPPESRWRVVPDVIQYANDYTAINQHCDWIEIMAYDQQRADIKLNDKRRGVPYMPVADTEWVEKVLELALKEFDSEKVLLGVPTYGRAWDVMVAPDWYRDYKRVATLNHPRIMELSAKYKAPIGRSAGGEAVISYFPDDSPWKVLDQLPTPPGTPKGFEAAAKALMVANYANIEVPVRFITWSDYRAIEDKFALVEKYDLRGVAIFKVDGEEDQRMWKRIK